jgi:hypothetical protein
VTPADEATFVTLWQQGASQQELAAQLRVPVGTIKSRASALARQGKIQARPKEGAYPRQRHQTAMIPAQQPVQSGADMHGARSVQSLPESRLRRPRGQHPRALAPLPQTRAAGAHRSPGPGPGDYPEPGGSGDPRAGTDRPSALNAAEALAQCLAVEE